MGKNSGRQAGGLFAAGFLSQGAGLGAIGCAPDDDSFYCKSSRIVMIIKNILFFALLAFVAYFLFKGKSPF